MKKAQINPLIGKLPAKDKAAWIADRKKARPDVDWDGSVKDMEAAEKAKADKGKDVPVDTGK